MEQEFRKDGCMQVALRLIFADNIIMLLKKSFNLSQINTDKVNKLVDFKKNNSPTLVIVQIG